MTTPSIVRHVDARLLAQIAELADKAAAVDGYRFLSDHLWLDLTSGAELLVTYVSSDEHLVAFGQASRTHSGWTIEATVHPAHRDAALSDLLARVVGALLDTLRREGGGHVTWWTHDVTATENDLALRLGLSADRDLLQLRRTLPTGLPVTVATRSFRTGEDEQALLDVNNRAFAGHGEQGGWDLAMLRRRQVEPWFDPDGIRLHEREGRLAAFCWTKLHEGREVPATVGEIYVIAVDPAFQGLGLGKQLTLAGLESIEQRGTAEAMLYVDASNEAAVGMYERLGFRRARVDRAFSTVLAPELSTIDHAG